MGLRVTNNWFAETLLHCPVELGYCHSQLVGNYLYVISDTLTPVTIEGEPKGHHYSVVAYDVQLGELVQSWIFQSTFECQEWLFINDSTLLIHEVKDPGIFVIYNIEFNIGSSEPAITKEYTIELVDEYPRLVKFYTNPNRDLLTGYFIDPSDRTRVVSFNFRQEDTLVGGFEVRSLERTVLYVELCRMGWIYIFEGGDTSYGNYVFNLGDTNSCALLGESICCISPMGELILLATLDLQYRTHHIVNPQSYLRSTDYSDTVILENVVGDNIESIEVLRFSESP